MLVAAPSSTSTPPLPPIRVMDGTPIVDWLKAQHEAGVSDEELMHGKFLDYVDETAFPVVLDGTTDGASTDVDAAAAVVQARTALTYMREVLHRDSWDGRGAAVDTVVHVPGLHGEPLANAFWSPFAHRLELGDGDDITAHRPMAADDDVIVHELGHAVWYHEVLRGQDADSAPSMKHQALSESFADMLAISVDKDDWTIGERTGIPSEESPDGYFRDISKPRWRTVQEIPKDGDIDTHDVGGIASLVGMHVAERFGRDEMMRTWTDAVNTGMSARGGFPMFAAATIASAARLLGADAARFVRDEWRQAGVRPSAPRQ